MIEERRKWIFEYMQLKEYSDIPKSADEFKDWKKVIHPDDLAAE